MLKNKYYRNVNNIFNPIERRTRFFRVDIRIIIVGFSSVYNNIINGSSG